MAFLSYHDMLHSGEFSCPASCPTARSGCPVEGSHLRSGTRTMTSPSTRAWHPRRCHESESASLSSKSCSSNSISDRCSPPSCTSTRQVVQEALPPQSWFNEKFKSLDASSNVTSAGTSPLLPSG